MNSPKNIVVIFGLFVIFGHFLGGAVAQPLKKKERNLFNYDDVSDYFQVHDQEKSGHKNDDCDSGKYVQQMPSKPVLSEDDAELALMSDMSIYTDDDVAWEHEHGRSGIFHGIPKPQKLRALPAAKTQPQPQPQREAPLQPQPQSSPHLHSHFQQLPLPIPLYSSYTVKDSKSYDQKDIMDPTDMSIGKWNWMEKILRQQAERV